MIMVVIYSVVLLVCLWILAMQDAISHWIDEADFEDTEQERCDRICNTFNIKWD